MSNRSARLPVLAEQRFTPGRYRALEAFATKDLPVAELAPTIHMTPGALNTMLERLRVQLGLNTRYGLVAWWWKNHGAKA